jgi:hypothetical protein
MSKLTKIDAFFFAEAVENGMDQTDRIAHEKALVRIRERRDRVELLKEWGEAVEGTHGLLLIPKRDDGAANGFAMELRRSPRFPFFEIKGFVRQQTPELAIPHHRIEDPANATKALLKDLVNRHNEARSADRAQLQPVLADSQLSYQSKADEQVDALPQHQPPSQESNRVRDHKYATEEGPFWRDIGSRRDAAIVSSRAWRHPAESGDWRRYRAEEEGSD